MRSMFAIIQRGLQAPCQKSAWGCNLPRQNKSSPPPKLLPIVAPACIGIRCNVDVHLRGCKLPLERAANGWPSSGAMYVDQMLYDKTIQYDEDDGTSSTCSSIRYHLHISWSHVMVIHDHGTAVSFMRGCKLPTDKNAWGRSLPCATAENSFETWNSNHPLKPSLQTLPSKLPFKPSLQTFP